MDKKIITGINYKRIINTYIYIEEESKNKYTVCIKSNNTEEIFWINSFHDYEDAFHEYCIYNRILLFLVKENCLNVK